MGQLHPLFGGGGFLWIDDLDTFEKEGVWVHLMPVTMRPAEPILTLQFFDLALR